MNKTSALEPFDMALIQRYSSRPNWPQYSSLIEAAAEAGNDWALYVQASWFVRGLPELGVKPDMKKAIKLLRISARSCPHAMIELARCYEDGVHVVRDLAEARRFLVKATEYGSVFAL